MSGQINSLNGWLHEVCAVLQLSEDELDLDEDARHVVLDLARDAKKQVLPPAGPLTAYLLGVAVGKGAALGGSAAKVQLALTADRSDGEPE